MKLLRLSLLVGMTLAAMVYAHATQWSYLPGARDLSYAVDIDSISTSPEGFIEYVAKTAWKVPAMLSGASQPVAISVTRYQIDCRRKRWRALDTHYLTTRGTSAGSLHPSKPDWTAIGPGTVIDRMFRKVC